MFCKRELKIPDEILVSIEQEDIYEDNVKGWTTDSAEDDEYDIEYHRKGNELYLKWYNHEYQAYSRLHDVENSLIQ